MPGASFKAVKREGGRVRSEADGPAITGPGLPVGQTRPPAVDVLKPAQEGRGQL